MQAAVEDKQRDMLARVARGSHGSSPSNHGSHHSDGVTQISATVACDEPGFSIPLSYSIVSKEIRDKRVAEAKKAWDLLSFVYGLSFNLINSPLFRAAILVTNDALHTSPVTGILWQQPTSTLRMKMPICSKTVD